MTVEKEMVQLRKQYELGTFCKQPANPETTRGSSSLIEMTNFVFCMKNSTSKKTCSRAERPRSKN